MHQRRDLYLAQISDLRRAAHGADRVDLVAALQAFVQTPDMHIGRAKRRRAGIGRRCIGVDCFDLLVLALAQGLARHRRCDVSFS